MGRPTRSTNCAAIVGDGGACHGVINVVFVLVRRTRPVLQLRAGKVRVFSFSQITQPNLGAQMPIPNQTDGGNSDLDQVVL